MKLRNSIISLMLLLGSVYAGATAVTATITDTDAQVWANCRWSVVLLNPRPDITPSAGGTPLTAGQITQTGTCNGSGVLSVTLVDSTTISPVGTSWRFTVTPNASSQAGSGSTSVSGSSQDLSVFLSGIVPVVRFAPGPSSYGYADGEVVGTPLPGQTYYNVTTPAFRQWSGTAWTTVGGGGGAGNCSAIGVVGTIQAATGTGGTCQASNLVDNSGLLISTDPFFAPSIGINSGTVISNVQGAYTIISFNNITADHTGMWIKAGNPGDSNIYEATIHGGLMEFAVTNVAGTGYTFPLIISETALTTPSGVLPSIDPAITVGQAVCVKAAGPPIVIGKCSTVVGAGGACTCI